MMPTEDLEAAIAELPAKKGVLREAFHTLAACSPYPLPFTWEDLDAHVSSVQSSISRRFSQLRALEAAGTARSSKNKEEDNEVEEEDEVVEEEEEEEEVEEEMVEEDEEEEQEEEEEEEQEEEEADDEIDNQKEEDREGGEDNKRDADEETLTTKVSAGQGKETEGEEELDGYAQGDGEEQGTEEEEMVEETTKKQLRGLPADGRKEFVEACKRMDAETLVEFVICFSISSKKLLSAMHHAPDPAALVLQVVKLLVSNKNFRCYKVWVQCITLFRWLSMKSAKHSADTTEQAKLVAKDWKKMIDNTVCCRELDTLSRGLLQFLIAYNIVSEFNIHDIISIFAMVRKGYKNNNIAKLCEDLGLADRATGLIDYMIGNGQHPEVFHLVQNFNLEDKYPPFSLLKGYIQKAKQTFVEMFKKSQTHESLNWAIPKELWIAHYLAEQKLTDSKQRSAIMAEIKYLMSGYEKKQRSENLSTWASQHPPTESKRRNRKRKEEEQEHHEAQYNQQQQEQNENKLIQGKRHQLHQENMAQVTQQQQQHMQPTTRPATLKLPTPAIPLVLNAAQIQNFARPAYAAVPGVHNYPAQPGWSAAQGSPFVPQFMSPQYMGLPFNPFGLHPTCYPRRR